MPCKLNDLNLQTTMSTLKSFLMCHLCNPVCDLQPQVVNTNITSQHSPPTALMLGAAHNCIEEEEGGCFIISSYQI